MEEIGADDRARLAAIAQVGHSVTDRDADFLLSLGAKADRASTEYPKAVYPEGSVYDDAAEPHLRGKPRPVVVDSADEEREVMALNPDERHDPVVAEEHA